MCINICVYIYIHIYTHTYVYIVTIIIITIIIIIISSSSSSIIIICVLYIQERQYINTPPFLPEQDAPEIAYDPARRVAHKKRKKKKGV